MDNYKFNLMVLKEQAQNTWEKGTCLAGRKESHFLFQLIILTWILNFFSLV
jgi:hypothetical protein